MEDKSEQPGVRAPALAGQPESLAVPWSRLCTRHPLPAFPSLLLPRRVTLQAAADALGAPSPVLTLACFYFTPNVVLPCRGRRGRRPRARQCLEMPSGRAARRSRFSRLSHI